ncbi:hypothetical protein ACLOJK_035558 [Asimina triloba]
MSAHFKSDKEVNRASLMQGQRSSVQSLPETFEFDHASSSSNHGTDQPLYWNGMMNPVEIQNLPDYLLSSGDTNTPYTNAVGHGDEGLASWNLNGPSLSSHEQNQSSHDEAKVEHGWPATVSTHPGPVLRLEERRFEPSNVLSLENVNINLSSNQDTSQPLHFQNPGANDIHQNATFNAGFVGHVGSETGQILPPGSSADPCATSSGTVDYMADEDDVNRPGCSLNSRHLSCKRKALEGVSGSSSLSGGPSCFHRAESSTWHAVPARHNSGSSLSISSPAEQFPSVSQDESMTQRFDIGPRMPSDYLPALSIAGNAETSQRNVRMRINPTHQQESGTPNLWTPSGNGIRRAHVWSSQHPSSSRHVPFNQPVESRSTAASTSSQSQSRGMPLPGFLRNVHSLSWNGALDGRAGSSSNSSAVLGDRASNLREEDNSRSLPRGGTQELSMFLPATDVRQQTLDSASWNLTTGNTNIPGNVASSSRVGSSSGVHPTPSPALAPHPPPTRHRRLSDAVRRSFTSAGQGSHFPPLRTASTSSHEMVIPSGASHQGHQHSYLRSAFLMDRQGDGVLGVPLALRNLAVGPEGRSRLSEGQKKKTKFGSVGQHNNYVGGSAMTFREPKLVSKWMAGRDPMQA